MKRKCNKIMHILRYGTPADNMKIKDKIDPFDYLTIHESTTAYLSKSISKFIVLIFFPPLRNGFYRSSNICFSK